MKLKAWALGFAVIVLGSGVGTAVRFQTAGDEATRVRQQLNIADSVPVILAATSELPKADPLKVYVAAGFDIEVRDRTLQRIAEWNKKDAEKYGRLEAVSDLTKADVILVQYSDRDHPISRVYGNSQSGVHTNTYIPGSSYIVVPQGEGYAVLWRYQGKSKEHGVGSVAGQTLRDHFFDMLKHRQR